MKHLSRFLFTLIAASSVASLSVVAQVESSVWYFGQEAALDFSQNPPKALTTGKLSTTEGVATISGRQGELLFYTDGVTVWNKQNEIMTNGEKLNGDPSATQAAVAVQLPGSEYLYYLFTVDEEGGPLGLCYSIIDLQKKEGLGEVTQKNTPIHTPITERLTAVKHRNGKDIWIVSHAWNSNAFMAYLLTDKGLQATPTNSDVGSVHQGFSDNTIGYLKSSPDGSQMAVAIKGMDVVELFDFDNQTGKLSNPVQLSFTKDSRPYGVEFSPSGSFLYVTAGHTHTVYQYNLQAGSDQAIVQSQVEIGKTKGWAGALQVAKDGKIYVSPYLEGKLDVIHAPDKSGMECRYESGAIDLLGKKSTLGFPTFIQSYFTRQTFTATVQDFGKAKNVTTGTTFILSNIYFDTDKSELKPTSFTELNKLAELLKSNPVYTIAISGHTDNVGNKSYNLKLSDSRAKAVSTYLVSKGIASGRITTSGSGNSLPIASNDTEDGRQRNRRVEFILNSDHPAQRTTSTSKD